ncbi:hypothetical protein BY98_04430 [Escherichia coli O111:NM str. K6728]|nr:hypothetical protein BY98_04430 [Escherichia coli O111:NM str. K6728]
MDVRQSIHSAHAKTLDTQGLRNEFLVEEVFVADEYTMVYSHIDRIIVGGIMPITKTVSVGGEVGKQLGVSYFLERRELGVINIGGAGTITVDGQCYEIGHRDALYVGKGAKEVVFGMATTSRSGYPFLNLIYLWRTGLGRNAKNNSGLERLFTDPRFTHRPDVCRLSAHQPRYRIL